MTTAATSLLGLALPVTGELSGTWGDTVNNSITSLLDTAIAGTTTLSTDADVTLTTTTLASNQARQAILLCSGARTGIKTITAPAQSKIYTIINATTGGYSVKLVGVGPTTGLTIPNGASAVVAWNGSDFIEIGSSTIGNLTVNGNLTVTGTTTLTGAATLTANPTLSAGTANGVAYLNGSKVVTTGSALTFDGTNLGIGTASPNQLLDVRGANGVGIRFLETTTGNTNRIQLGTGSGYGYIDATAGAGSTALAFQVASTEQMRLTSTGLGIGTSSPSEKLTVAGNIKLGTSGTAWAYGPATTGRSFFSNSDGTAYIGVYGSAYGGSSNSIISFVAGTTNSMTFDSSGNLGLGVTPSAWASDWKVMQIGSRSAFSQYNVNSSAVVSNNLYFAGTGGSSPTYINTAAASFYQQVNGSHVWYNAPSGTAGTTITTFTQAMTLDASGNLGVGTTSPVSRIDARSASAVIGNYQQIQAFSTNTAAIDLGGGISLGGYYSGTSGLASFGTIVGRKENGTDGNYAGYLAFGTNAQATGIVERARIDSSGNLLVGTTSTVSNARFVSKSSTSSASDQAFQFQNSSGSVLLTCRADGYLISLPVYNQTSGSAANVYVNTDGGLYRSTSSLKYKTDIQDATHGLTEVLQLRPVTYKGKSDADIGKTFGGLIAEEVHAAGLTEFVQYAEDGSPDALAYGNMVSLCIKAIQEQQALITQLTERITALESK